MEEVKDISPVTKNNNFLITLLSVLLLIAVFIAGFFAYQTQNLVKELTRLQVTPTPVATNTPLPNTETDYSGDFSFKLSKEWYRETKSQNPVQFVNYTPAEFDTDFDPKTNVNQLKIEVYVHDNESNIQEVFDSIKKSESNMNLIENKILVDNQPAILVDTESNFGKYSYVLVKNPAVNRVYSITFGLNFYNQKLLRDEILSTFKFIAPTTSPSPLPVACTMEAKICPDGSAVGRTGPKCEFAPCPTSIN